uniref:YfhO family protein n=2 Tax=Flavobacterium sp. TaxID=239 RepID=UPI00404935E4
MTNLKKLVPHLLAFLGFVVVALLYFYPVLQNKVIYQSDIVQYIGMAQEQNNFRAENDAEPYWTNAAFGGMPTYQLGAKYPHNYIKNIDSVLRFLPRPADYLFLYFLGFYLLLLVLKVDPLKAFFGALVFGFSTYLIIILGVGHNAKAHAIAYMPAVIAGIILVFQKRLVLGGLLTLLASGLEIQANHPQMSYYLLLFILILVTYYVVHFVNKKEFKFLFQSLTVLVFAGILSLGLNATSLLATAEYAKFSTRGQNDLTFNPDGSPIEINSGMSYDYITEYSYGKAESLNLIAPRLFGGGNSEQLDEKSHVFDYIIKMGASPDQALGFAQQLPTYWGDQPIVAAPAYIGAIVFFLAILALFTEKRKIKYVFLGGIILSLLLSWGKNFPILTDFFIDSFPLYNKFRAVSSIQVILELCTPVLAILGLVSFFKIPEDAQKKSLIKAGGITIAFLLILWMSVGLFTFEGGYDAYLMQSFTENYDANFAHEIIQALKLDRESMYTSDLFRSALLIVLTIVLLFGYLFKKISQPIVVIAIGFLMVMDLVLIDQNYVNKDSFVTSRIMNQPFQATEIDKEILEDKALHYRVFEPQLGLSNARTSYFHKSIGGYSAVKPQRMQQLYDYQITNGNTEALDMLNVKYIIQSNQGQDMYSLNPFANGNAWFIENIEMVETADAEMKSLDSLDSKKTAILNTIDFPEIANELKSLQSNVIDSTQTIQLTKYQPNLLEYQVNNAQNSGVAVFSELYYPKGWKATIDGKEAEMFRVNYVLRALMVPKNAKKIVFSFEPEVVKTGSQIALMSSIAMFLLFVSGLLFYFRKAKSSVVKP